MSCGAYDCVGATIPYVVGPSCTGGLSCQGATIGSVDSSCNDFGSCISAQLSGVDLINSCNALGSCQSATNGNGVFDELIDCCNVVLQCQSKDGLDIVAAGCVSYCL